MSENLSNFDKSCKFFEQNLTDTELYKYLENGNLAQRQLACLKIKTLSTPEQAKILMQNLTGIDGKVREAVSFKLKTFIPQHSELFEKQEFYDIFLEAIIDINGNICRNIICSLENLPASANYMSNEIIKRSHKVLNIIDKFDYKDKKYVTNKELFKVYWYLETLSIFPPADGLFELLKRTAKIDEYTIREKTAQLLTKLSPDEAKSLQGLNFDDNFYVNLALKR